MAASGFVRTALSVLVPVLVVACATTTRDTGPADSYVAPTVIQVSAGYNRPAAIDAYRDVIASEHDSTKRFIARWRLAALLLQGSNVTTRDLAQSVDIFRQLLQENSNNELTDDLYYQLARAYETNAQLDDAVRVLGELISRHPESEYIAEAQYRRAEIFFDEALYAQAIQDYQAVIGMTEDAPLHDYALYKKGWAQLLAGKHDEGIKSFIALFDRNELLARQLYKPAEDEDSRIIAMLLQDAVRAITLAFTYIDSDRKREKLLAQVNNESYADVIYESLARSYESRQRYSDAAKVYTTFVRHLPDHERAPYFLLKVQDIYHNAGFASQELETKRDFVEQYGMGSTFWRNNRMDAHPRLIKSLKSFIQDLAGYYHALTQKDHSARNAAEAEKWYRTYIKEFPNDRDTPGLQYLLADLLFERGHYEKAVVEYEHVAYDYPLHSRSAESGYAALQTYDRLMKNSHGPAYIAWRDKQIESSVRFGERFPRDRRSAEILAKTASSLMEQGHRDEALAIARKLVSGYPNLSNESRVWAWLTIADSQFDKKQYRDSETAYKRALDIMPVNHASRQAARERYALSIYRQGEIERDAGNPDQAIAAFARVRTATSNETMILTADYDAAALLISGQQWGRAIPLLQSIKGRQTDMQQRAETIRKLAYAYRESGRIEEAADEYDNLSHAGVDTALRIDSVREAAQLHEKVKQYARAITSYRYLLNNFTLAPHERINLTYHVATLYKQTGDNHNYQLWLSSVIDEEKALSDHRDVSIRTLAATAALELARPTRAQYNATGLRLPLNKSLPQKKAAMEKAIKAYGRAIDYGIAEISTEAIYEVAELYHDFSRALLDSPRPRDLSGLALEQYNILLEEQVYPLEEQAITIHESNIKYLHQGLYNRWIGASLGELAKLLPVRYDKQEVMENIIEPIS